MRKLDILLWSTLKEESCLTISFPRDVFTRTKRCTTFNKSSRESIIVIGTTSVIAILSLRISFSMENVISRLQTLEWPL